MKLASGGTVSMFTVKRFIIVTYKCHWKHDNHETFLKSENYHMINGIYAYLFVDGCCIIIVMHTYENIIKVKLYLQFIKYLQKNK
jgi:hypothetical protein